ncbi:MULTISPECIES: peptidoglycan editing factor PgeF [Sphingobium]|uniref:Purine nucleoside phosphorylase n=1 Tax=Sphingobium fuliginis (strain ATCC 27551) TaxID=336203 RepID=A0ABQ1F803_SPHSA|nr:MULTISPECIES: peptidoglycan editing factor PgeF [Sphingobium]AJR23990.1 polyphenol oxidase [Sphingobium sp. YBL2]RYL96441.1 peptidoglycan editing factor PgeF [Sphingobium fuliginis]WDA36017.1 peptidoglycan editing factor PgeF [Sphingobium sp. YC-XJ3]GGA02524.1 laccase domain protein [Sphingobium fuliginis]
MVELLRAAGLGDVLHGFAGRRGGVSTGIHAGLNVGLGSEDERGAVLRNRDLARDALLPGATLVTVHQVHSPDVVTVTAPVEADERPAADAMVTDRPGLILGILTADCVPVLFADASAGVVGAAHAGWKGALGGVTDRTIEAMEALGAARDRIACAIGPCIGRSSYEVTLDFAERFAAADAENDRFFSAGREGHCQFDIAAYVAARLADAGIGQIELLDEDTYGQPDRFYSYRRSCHRGEADYGRQISMIALQD